MATNPETIKTQIGALRAEAKTLKPGDTTRLRAIKAEAAKLEANYVNLTGNTDGLAPEDTTGTRSDVGGKGSEGAASFKAKAGATSDRVLEQLSDNAPAFVDAFRANGRTVAGRVERFAPGTAKIDAGAGAVNFSARLAAAFCNYTLVDESCPLDSAARPIASKFPFVPAPFGKFHVQRRIDVSAIEDGITTGWTYGEVDACTGEVITERSKTKNCVEIPSDCVTEDPFQIEAHSVCFVIDNCDRFFNPGFVDEIVRVSDVALARASETAYLEQVYDYSLSSGQAFEFAGDLGSRVTAYEAMERLLMQLSRRNRGSLDQDGCLIIDQELARLMRIDTNNVGFCCPTEGPLAGFDVVVTLDHRAANADSFAYLGVEDAVTPLVREEVCSEVLWVPNSAFVAVGPDITYGFDAAIGGKEEVLENKASWFNEEHSVLVMDCPPASVKVTHCPDGSRSALKEAACVPAA